MGCPRFHLLGAFFRLACHGAAFLSALALLAGLLLWPLSYRRTDMLLYATSTQGFILSSGAGQAGLSWNALKTPPTSLRSSPIYLPPGFHRVTIAAGAPPQWSYTAWRTESIGDFARPRTRASRLGLTFDYSTNRPLTYLALFIPYSYLTLLAALPPLLWLRGFRRQRQARRARPGFPIEPPSPSEPRPSGSVAADSPPPAR